MYLIIIRKKGNILTHASYTLTYIRKHVREWVTDENDSTIKYEYCIKEMKDATIEKKKLFWIALDWKKSNPKINFNVMGDRDICKAYIYTKKNQLERKEREDFRYTIVIPTCNDYDMIEDDNYLNSTDDFGRIRCYAKQRSSGEYDIYSCTGNEHWVVDNYRELKEFFDEDVYYQDRYYLD